MDELGSGKLRGQKKKKKSKEDLFELIWSDLQDT